MDIDEITKKDVENFQSDFELCNKNHFKEVDSKLVSIAIKIFKKFFNNLE